MTSSATLRDRILSDLRATLIEYQRSGQITNINLPEKVLTPISIGYGKSETGHYDLGEYVSCFVRIHEAKDYICTLFDNSVIQGYYLFESAGDATRNLALGRATLCYYPNPGIGTHDIYDIQFEADSAEKKALIDAALLTNDEFRFSSNYVRLEFNSGEDHYTPILHPCTHLHIGANNDLRLSANRMLYFSEFLDFIFYVYYRDKWLETAVGLGKSSKNAPVDFTEYINRRVRFRKTNMLASKLTDLEKEHILVNL